MGCAFIPLLSPPLAAIPTIPATPATPATPAIHPCSQEADGGARTINARAQRLWTVALQRDEGSLKSLFPSSLYTPP